jgi:opacity protein-like surface antigen
MKLIVSRAVCAAAAVAILCAATAASAQPPAKNGFYAGFGAGADFPSDIPFSVHVNGGGLAVAVAGHVNLDTSAAGSATFGYRFNDYFATEGEFGYADFGIGSINLKVSALGLSKSGKFGLDGDVQAFTGFANLVVTPWGHNRFTPYIGGGIGVGNTDTKVKSVSVPGLGSLPISQSRNETDFAAQAIVGVDFALTSRFDIGARYKFFWIDSGQTETRRVACGCVTAKGELDDFMAQSVMGTATLHW